MKTYAVTGHVLCNSEPLKGVGIAFHPTNPKNDTGYPTHATTDENGKFTLMTYVAGDGSVRFVCESISVSTFAALITRNGGEILGE